MAGWFVGVPDEEEGWVQVWNYTKRGGLVVEVRRETYKSA
jgi:hypothetical protein